MASNRASRFRFIIGIDLGTTQCALSFVDLNDQEAGVRHFPVLQLVSGKEVASLPTLPSLIFLPDAHFHFPETPWNEPEKAVVGRFAQELGCEVPSRLIHSAKSWLCHPRIDRKAAILPWQSDAVSEKWSPVRVAAAYLNHLKATWNHHYSGEGPEAEFTRQKVVITIPASFDPSARNLTLEAITLAGIPHVTLLEEPQAAFYDFISRHSAKLKQELAKSKQVLVVDVGGGTTDFSLIEVDRPRDSSQPAFNRVAVGPHLLIGGDNIDLTVAKIVEARLRHRGKKLLLKQWLGLLSDARNAKEQIFSGQAGSQAVFTISGAGSKVISQTVKEEIPVEEIRNAILEGFFPMVPPEARPMEEGALGLSEAGLPYSRDPGITRHLAAFLADNRPLPDTVLFNGGTTLSRDFRDRIIENLTAWRDGKAPKVLENPHPTLAVALGAAYFGMTSLGLGQTIKSGSAVSIYLGVGDDPASTPNQHIPNQLFCLLPKGSENEVEYRIPEKTFGVDRSRDVAFYLYYSTTAVAEEKPGFEAPKNSKRFRPLPPITLPAEASEEHEIKQVNLGVRLRETGYLQIFCHAPDGSLVQELTFDVAPPRSSKAGGVGKKAKQAMTKKQAGEIEKFFDGLFGLTPAEIKKSGQNPFNLVFKNLEEIFDSPRKNWDLPLLRALFDLTVGEDRFKDSLEGLKCYFRILGFCLRPGFGAPEDNKRLELLWQLFHHPYETEDIAFWSEWWLLWKRVAPGLSTSQQRAIQEAVEPMLFPPKKPPRGLRKPDQHERNNLWRLIGQLERLPPEEKDRLGWWILKNPPSFGKDSVALFALGRLGARQKTYADQTLIVSLATVQAWADTLLKRVAVENSYLDWALKEIGRKTGDRLVQLDDSLRKKIIEVLRRHNRKKEFLSPLLEVQTISREDFAEFIGEQLPSGFVWVRDS